MFATGVHLELGQQAIAEAILGEHAFDRMQNEPFRVHRPNLGDSAAVFATLPPRVAHVLFGRLFFAGQDDLLGVYDDNEVAGIKMRSKNGLVLAP